jgi:ABC-type transport system involved in multi-copper enzyme maturation permease subunit
MNPRIAKDIRAVLPFFGLTLAGAIVPGLLCRSDPVGPMTAAFGFASILMAAMVLGHDVQPGTLALLLAQPLPRSRLWREKMQVLGVALGAGFAALFVGILLLQPSELSRREFWLVAGLTTFGAFCTTPYWTLLYRSPLLALFSTVIAPLLLLTLHALVYQKWIRLPVVEEESAVILLAVYCAVLGWLGWRRFKNLQIVDAHVLRMQRELSLPPALEGWVQRHFSRTTTRWRGSFAALFKKEIRLQLVTFIATGLFCLIVAAGAMLWPMQREQHMNWGEVLLVLGFGFFVPMLPLLAGTMSVAEEKAWGVADWHLTLPPSLRRQWWVKVATALFTSFALGFLLPMACYLVGQGLLGVRESGSSVPSLPELLNLALGNLLMTSVAMLAGTITSNTSRALALADGLIVAAGLTIFAGLTWVPLVFDRFAQFTDVLDVVKTMVDESRVWLVTAELVILLGLAHGLAYRCHRARGLKSEVFSFLSVSLSTIGTLLALVLLLLIAFSLDHGAEFAAQRRVELASPLPLPRHRP